MKTITIKLLSIAVLFCMLFAVASGQNRFEVLCDSAVRQTDVELFGTDNPTYYDIRRVTNKRTKDDCNCKWIVDKFDKYVAQLDSGKITTRDLKSYILDIRLLIEIKNVCNGR